MKPEQIVPFIGLAWEQGATGPDAFDCWGLLCHIQAKYFNRHLPHIVVTNPVEARDAFEEYVGNGDWEKVEFPNHGDGVLLRGGADPHVGVWLDVDGGIILHSMRGYGVITSTMRTVVALGFGRMTFYRFNK